MTQKDEIIIAAFNCFVVPQAILSVNAKPIFIDINEKFQIDINELQHSINDKTKCIIVPVHDGFINDFSAIYELAKKRNIKVLIDAAHCMPTKKIFDYFCNNQVRVDGIVFSFSHSKNFSLMCGGMLYISDYRLSVTMQNVANATFVKANGFIEIIRVMNLFLWSVLAKYPLFDVLIRLFQRIFVLPEITKKELTGVVSKDNNNQRILKYKLALLIRNIDYFEDWVELRRRNYNFYKKFLQSSQVKIPNLDNEFSTPLHCPIIYEGNVDELLGNLFSHNIYVDRWFSPQMFPNGNYHATMEYVESNYPVSYEISSKIISLPISPKLSENDIKFVASIINST